MIDTSQDFETILDTLSEPQLRCAAAHFRRTAKDFDPVLAARFRARAVQMESRADALAIAA